MCPSTSYRNQILNNNGNDRNIATPNIPVSANEQFNIFPASEANQPNLNNVATGDESMILSTDSDHLLSIDKLHTSQLMILNEFRSEDYLTNSFEKIQLFDKYL